MKVCSFLPAATQMIYDLRLDHLLHGVTFECPPQALEEKTVVVRCEMEGKCYSSEEIDRVFSSSVHRGRSLYYTEDDLLEEISPDIIFTQDVCEVCQINTVCTRTAVAKLSKTPETVILTPQSLQDVFDSVETIASALGYREAGVTYMKEIDKRLWSVVDSLRRGRVMPRRIMLMEWMEPIYNCGHWIPHQIGLAGGIDMLSNPSGDSIVTPWEKVLKYDPEVLVIAPCGFKVDRTLEEIHLLASRPGWESMKAVSSNEVYVVDYELFTQPSASTLVDGIELLAGIIHPDHMQVSDRLQRKFKNLEAIELNTG